MKLGTKTGTNAKCEGNGFEFSEGNSYFRKNTLGLLFRTVKSGYFTYKKGLELK